MVVYVLRTDVPADDANYRPSARRDHLIWSEGKGHTGEKTAWYAFQAVAEALDFNRDLWPTRAGSWRTASLLNGQLAELKNRVLDNLVGYAAAA